MKKLNKNGFTLVELLAVIVVLAVIMLLAVNAVLPQMNKARKNAFITEAQTFIDAAGTYYQSAMLTGDENFTSAGGCVNVSDLIGPYVEKENKADYSGYVTITIDPSSNEASYKIQLANKQFFLGNEGGTAVALIESAKLKEKIVFAGDKDAGSCPAGS